MADFVLKLDGSHKGDVDVQSNLRRGPSNKGVASVKSAMILEGSNCLSAGVSASASSYRKEAGSSVGSVSFCRVYIVVEAAFKARAVSKSCVFAIVCTIWSGFSVVSQVASG